MTITTLLRRAAAAGVRLLLEGTRVRFQGRATPALLAELRQHKAEVVLELRRRAGEILVASDTDHEADGELGAYRRESDLLRRVETGLGPGVSATLWRVLDRVLAAHDVGLAERLWRHVVEAERRGIFSRLVAWLRALDGVGDDLVTVHQLVQRGVGGHPYHDAEGIDQ